MQVCGLWPAIPTDICLIEWMMTDEPDLTEDVSSLGMPEVAEKIEMLLCARTGCAAQMAPCTSFKHATHQAASSNRNSMSISLLVAWGLATHFIASMR